MATASKRLRPASSVTLPPMSPVRALRVPDQRTGEGADLFPRGPVREFPAGPPVSSSTARIRAALGRAIMTSSIDRRELLALASLGGLGLVARSALAPAPARAKTAPAAQAPAEDFFFVQLSDTHWGFRDPAINPDFEGTLKRVIARVN